VTDTDTAALPPDDPERQLTVTDRDAPDVAQVFLVGDTYSVLISGQQTNGRYCLIDMHVPDGGGPPPHRHDFEEMFTILEGEIQFTFRGDTVTATAGSTVNIPANAPHFFRNVSGQDARLLCMCTPAGQDEYFLQVGDRLESRTARPPQLDDQQLQERKRTALELAAQYRTEMLG